MPTLVEWQNFYEIKRLTTPLFPTSLVGGGWFRVVRIFEKQKVEPSPAYHANKKNGGSQEKK
jgi:hypothetical protein